MTYSEKGRPEYCNCLARGGFDRFGAALATSDDFVALQEFYAFRDQLFFAGRYL